MWDEADSAVADATPNTDLPDPFVVPALAGLSATSGTATLLVTADGTIVPQVVLAWTAITSAYVVPRGKVLLRWRANASMLWHDLPPVPADATGTSFAGVQEADHITIEARVRNTLGQLSPAVYLGHVVVGKAALPATVSGFSATAIPGGVQLAWTPSTEADHLETEIRVGASWAAGTVLFKGRAGGYVWPWPSAGSYTLRAKHRDTSGGESASDATASITVGAGSLIGTAQIGVESATEVYVTTPGSAVTVTGIFTVPDGYASVRNTVVATVSFTPAASGTAQLFFDGRGQYVNASGSVSGARWSIQDDGGTFDVWKRVDQGVAVGASVSFPVQTSRRFNVTGGVTYSFSLYASKLDTGDTFTIDQMELRAEVVKR